MKNTARSILGIVAIVVTGLAVLAGGIYFARVTGSGGHRWGMMHSPAASAGVKGQTATGSQTSPAGNLAFGPMGSGMIFYGMTSNGVGQMGGSMMGGSAVQSGVKPLSIPAAQNAVQAYLAGLHNSDLTVGEVLIFDNQAYARIDEKSTGHAALEVLVDPVTLAVYPEPGANMMWNLKYGMMGGYMGGYMGGATAAKPNDPMPVTVVQAVETAQGYLDTYQPGAKAETKADAFYGYYTLEIQRNGQTAGMLSVNGYTRQVILHTWHGHFIETSSK